MKTFTKYPMLLCALTANLGMMPGGRVTAQTFTVLHSFAANPGQINSDGAYPASALVLSSNTLYGTAIYGGSAGYGTAFRVNTDGTSFTNLHSFTAVGSDGGLAIAGLILSGSTLYGTTYGGGSWSDGMVFKINTDGTGFTNVYSFTAKPSATNSDGALPYAGLIISSNALYGTTSSGGASGYGTVFRVIPCTNQQRRIWSWCRCHVVRRHPVRDGIQRGQFG